MPQMNDFEHIARRQGGLNKHLTAGQMSMLAIGGAIGTGLFLGSAYAIQMAGPSVLLSYLIGGVIALLLMGSLAEMTSEHPTPGSFGDYAEFYLGPLFGFLVRYSYWSCVVLAVGTEVTAIGMYMQFWFPATPTWPWVLPMPPSPVTRRPGWAARPSPSNPAPARPGIRIRSARR